MSSTALASLVSTLAILGCCGRSRWLQVPARRAISSATMTPVAASPAGSNVSRRLPWPAKIPVASPAPKTISASASIAVLRTAQVELAFGDLVLRHPEPVLDECPTPMPPKRRPRQQARRPAGPRRHAGPTAAHGRPGRPRYPGPRSRSTRRQIRSPTAPRALRDEHPLPGNMLEAMQRLLECRDQLKHRIGHGRCLGPTARAREPTKRSSPRPCRARRTDRRTRAPPPAPPFR